MTTTTTTTTSRRVAAFDNEPQRAASGTGGAAATPALHTHVIAVQHGTAVALDMERVQQEAAAAAQPAQLQRRAGPAAAAAASGPASKNNSRHAGSSRDARSGQSSQRAHGVQRASPSDGFSGRYAVDMRRVQHSYDGKKPVLQKLNLQIEPGQIYGLLGPSGCGKTTLIRCLLASLTPQEGSIRVFGEEPGSVRSEVPGHDVGYMPQEIALYEEFTIMQNLNFYGKLHNMSAEEFSDRAEYLCKLLDIHDVKDRGVAKLSGGQQRRTSLACGLLHSPKLLILDEPTVVSETLRGSGIAGIWCCCCAVAARTHSFVLLCSMHRAHSQGVDPTLRTKIWKYLTKISREEGTTVLLTTHYIEEARQAHRVGLMRAGKMLLQGTPRGIMNQTHSRTLEQAFLKICKKDEKESDKDEHDKSNEDDDDDEEDGELDSPSSEDEAGGDGEAEAAALNQGSAGAGAGAGSNDSSSRGPNRSPLSSPSGRTSARSGSGSGSRSYAAHEDTDKDDSALREKRPSSKESGGKATFAGITNQDYHEPLLTRTPTPTATPAGWAKANKGGAGSTRHLQSPDPDNGNGVDEELDDDDDEEQEGKGTSKNRDGDRAPPLEGCAKITAALALPRWPQLWALSWKNLMRMAKGVAALIFQFVLPR